MVVTWRASTLSLRSKKASRRHWIKSSTEQEGVTRRPAGQAGARTITTGKMITTDTALLGASSPSPSQEVAPAERACTARDLGPQALRVQHRQAWRNPSQGLYLAGTPYSVASARGLLSRHLTTLLPTSPPLQKYSSTSTAKTIPTGPSTGPPRRRYSPQPSTAYAPCPPPGPHPPIPPAPRR